MQDNQSFHKEATLNGQAAEGRIGGALRGGFVYKGMFTANGPVGTHHVKTVSDVKELKIHNN